MKNYLCKVIRISSYKMLCNYHATCQIARTVWKHGSKRTRFNSVFRNTKTYIWDITDLDNIKLMNTYVHDIEVIDHNQYIKETIHLPVELLGKSTFNFPVV